MSVRKIKYDPNRNVEIPEMTDEEITAAALSDPDNPPLTEEQLEHMVEYGVRGWELPGKNANERNRAFAKRLPREKITFECDADVAAWLKAKDKYYRGRINRLLRKAMEAGWDVNVSPFPETAEELEKAAAFAKFRQNIRARKEEFAAAEE